MENDVVADRTRGGGSGGSGGGGGSRAKVGQVQVRRDTLRPKKGNGRRKTRTAKRRRRPRRRRRRPRPERWGGQRMKAAAGLADTRQTYMATFTQGHASTNRARGRRQLFDEATTL